MRLKNNYGLGIDIVFHDRIQSSAHSYLLNLSVDNRYCSIRKSMRKNVQVQSNDISESLPGRKGDDVGCGDGRDEGRQVSCGYIGFERYVRSYGCWCNHSLFG